MTRTRLASLTNPPSSVPRARYGSVLQIAETANLHAKDEENR
jgi:hypothetical protein